ncbi:MAG: glycosyltransferase [Hyphomicrobiales bacterium]|nr:glycosyltransferase [Hyphomicrobiales bacterium]
MSERASSRTRNGHVPPALVAGSPSASTTPGCFPATTLGVRETFQLSPLAGQRLLMTISCADEGIFESRLSFDDSLEAAGTLFTHGIETVLVPVGCGPDEAQALAARRIPGLSFATESLPALDVLADTDADRLLDEIAASIGADLVLLHDPALATHGRRLPQIVSCTSSPILEWRSLHGDQEPPPDIACRTARECRGLHAADLIIVPSLSFAEGLKREHGLAQLPTVVHPNAKATSASPKARDLTHDAFILTADPICSEGDEIAMLDRAAGRMGGVVISIGSALDICGRAVCFETIHTVGPLSTAETQGLLARAPVFVSATRFTSFGRIVLQAAAQGCALILSDIPAHREFWNGAACFVPCGDEGAFAAAMRRTLEDDSHRRVLSETASRRAGTLSLNRMGNGIHAAFVSLSERGPLTAAG